MRTLLLADESITVQRVIVLTFAQEPVRVVTASDGHQAMDRVVVDRPDIVLVGTTLPHVNGYDLSRFVRSKAESKDVPVLLLSGAFESINEAELLSSGANGVIEKPVEPTSVIRRVKELLGLKAKDATPPAGRLVTPSTLPSGQRPVPSPTLARTVTTSQHMPAASESLRGHTVDEDTQPVEETMGRDDYLESLGDAFDTLDQQLAGRKATSREARDEMRAPELGPPPAAAPPVYEVDDEWFAEDQKARAARQLEQRELAREMGIHEVTLPEPPSVADPHPINEAPKPAEVRHLQEPVTPIVEVALASAAASQEPDKAAAPSPVVELTLSAHRDEDDLPIEPIARTLPIDLFAATGTTAGKPAAPTSQETPAASPAHPAGLPHLTNAFLTSIGEPRRDSRDVADDFEALLAFERGAKPAPPVIEPIIRVVTPEITGEMLQEIATRVADHLTDKVRVEPVAPQITEAMLEQIASTVSRRLHDSIRIEPVAPAMTGEIVKTIAFLVAGSLKDTIRVEPAVAEITMPMLQQIAATVADRLKDSIRVEPRAPQISGEMLETMAYYISGTLKDSVRVEPAAPVITDAIIQQLAATMSERVAGSLHVEARVPEISAEMLDRVAGTVADRLKDSIRVEPVVPPIDDAMLDRVAATVADRLKDSIRVEPAVPPIDDAMLDRVAATVADRLKDGIRVEPVAPQISDAMLDRVADNVSARLKDSIRVEPAIPELNGSMLDRIAGTMAARLADTVRESVRVETVAPAITIEMLDHVAARVSARVQTSMPPPPVAPEITADMLEHVAARLAERLQSSMPPPPVAPQITDDMLERVAGRVAERLQAGFSIDHLRDSIAGAIHETVRAVVSETSERLVREEIERIRSKAQ